MKYHLILVLYSLRFCISDEFPGDAVVAGLWTTLGVARYRDHFQIFKPCVPRMSRTLNLGAMLHVSETKVARHSAKPSPCEGPAVMGTQQILFFSKPGTLGILSCLAHRCLLARPNRGQLPRLGYEAEVYQAHPFRENRGPDDSSQRRPSCLGPPEGWLAIISLLFLAHSPGHTPSPIQTLSWPGFGQGQAHWSPHQAPLPSPASTTHPCISSSFPMVAFSSL